jgi:hypothetical protein
VKVLAGDFLERHPAYSERIGALLLGLLLLIDPGAAGSKLFVAALKAIKRINHPLLGGEYLWLYNSVAIVEYNLCNAACFLFNALAGDVQRLIIAETATAVVDVIATLRSAAHTSSCACVTATAGHHLAGPNRHLIALIPLQASGSAGQTKPKRIWLRRLQHDWQNACSNRQLHAVRFQRSCSMHRCRPGCCCCWVCCGHANEANPNQVNHVCLVVHAGT